MSYRPALRSLIATSLSLLLVAGLGGPAVAMPDVPRGPGVTTAAGGVDTDGLVVTVAPGQRAAAVQAMRAHVGDEAIERLYGDTGYRLDVPEQAAAAVQRALERVPGIDHVEPDVIHRAATSIDPDDPYWRHQWGPKRIGAPESWAVTTGSDNVVVAVLDTGVSPHPDLEDALLEGRSFVAGEPTTEDLSGHGTGVAGVIAARGDNGRDVAGMCWQCRILPVKVLSAEGSGSGSGVAAGIRWATDQGADIINLSLGSPTSGTAMQEAVDYAVERGVLLVAAASNEGSTSPAYPAALPGVLGVAASQDDDRRYSWSNHGDWVDVAAPGCVVSLKLPDGVYGPCGTSFSAPLVAGVAALAYAEARGLTAVAAREAITATSVPLSYVRHGRVDSSAALMALTSEVPEPGPDPEPELEPQPVTAMVERIAGLSRFATAAALSAENFEPGVERVYIATGRDFPDALAAAPVAASADAPVLLTNNTLLPEETSGELSRLAPDEIVIVGGVATVSSTVAIALRAYAPVRRIAGTNRYDTAAKLATSTFAGPVDTVYLASGRDFPDALSGGAVAARDGAPLLLTAPDALPEETVAALEDLQPRRVVVLGGEVAVSRAVLQEARAASTDGEAIRQSGTSRYDTSAAISRSAFPDETSTLYLATGRDFPDALAAAPVAGGVDAPLLMTAPNVLPEVIADEIVRLAPERIVVVGGEQVVHDGVIDAALASLAKG